MAVERVLVRLRRMNGGRRVDGTEADSTVASLLHAEMVPWETLADRYGSLLELVRVLLGVVPNCDPYLEIWPPAFRTYNVMVANFLNLPVLIFGVGGPPSNVVGLGMYVISRTAECPYCSAHSCSFALRRGASAEKMARALVADGASFSRGELATIAVARSLGRIPCELTSSERDELIAVYGADKAEWLVLAMVMMGFLNKFMAAIGVELEQPVYDEVSQTLGADWGPGVAGGALKPSATKPPPPTDGLAAKLRVVPMLPTAIRLHAGWQQGVPKAWPQAGAYLRGHVGHDFPVLSRLRHSRAVRAITTMLRDNLDVQTTFVGLQTKLLAGMIFATIVADDELADEIRAVSSGLVSDQQLAEAVRFAESGEPGLLADAPPASLAALILSRAASPSPPRINSSVVAACRESSLGAAAIVEVISWLSLLQMLHRLTCFYPRTSSAVHDPSERLTETPGAQPQAAPPIER